MNFRQEVVQAVKSITSTVFNFGGKREHFPHSAAPTPPFDTYTLQMSRANSGRKPVPHPDTQTETWSCSGLGMVLEEGFGLFLKLNGLR